MAPPVTEGLPNAGVVYKLTPSGGGGRKVCSTVFSEAVTAWARPASP